VRVVWAWLLVAGALCGCATLPSQRVLAAVTPATKVAAAQIHVGEAAGPLAAGAALVNGASQKLLARARLSQKQHGGVRCSDLRHLVEDAEQGAALADNLLEPVLG